MASEKNITMRQYNGVDYDTLYPKTIAEQVIGIYSKDEILGDLPKQLLNLSSSAIPSDAFLKLALGGANKYLFNVTIKTDKNNPIVGLTLSEFLDIHGNTATTDSSGNVVILSNTQTITISIQDMFIDLENFNQSFTVPDGLVSVDCNITLIHTGDTSMQLTNTMVRKFSPEADKLSTSMIGGGASGYAGRADEASNAESGGNGGKGGEIVTIENIQIETSLLYTFTVGAGGGQSGNESKSNAGGNTTIKAGDTTVAQALGGSSTATHNGGNPGTAASRGTAATSGSSSTGLFWNDSNSLKYAAGGGGGGASGYAAKSGGVLGGGNGGNEGSPGTDATAYGSGGGGGGYDDYNTQNGGAGYQGLIEIRWSYKEAV